MKFINFNIKKTRLFKIRQKRNISGKFFKKNFYEYKKLI